MTWFSKFKPNAVVQRKLKQDGTVPVYSFKGIVCGSYKNPADKSSGGGAVVMSLAEYGCVQVFPDYMLEVVD